MKVQIPVLIPTALQWAESCRRYSAKEQEVADEEGHPLQRRSSCSWVSCRDGSARQG